MKKCKIACQKTLAKHVDPNTTVLVPRPEYADSLKEFIVNQILEVSIDGEIDPRSLRQLALYWVLCKKVADNSDFPSTADVDEYVKIKARYVDIRYDHLGNQHIKTKSISFKEMKQKSFNEFMNKSTGIMADFLGTTEEALIGSQNDI